MSRLIIVVITSLMLCIFCLSGCSKKSEPPTEEVKTMQEYQAEAKEQINEKNMEQELETLEKDIEQDINQEQ